MKPGLLWYCLPLKKAEEYLTWHTQTLDRYFPLFTGRRIAVVAIGDGTLDPDWNKGWFDNNFDTVHVVANDPQLREVKGWNKAVDQITKNEGPVFWSHAKGVTRIGGQYESCAIDWTDLLYRTSLDVPQAVWKQLEQFPLAGSLKRIGRCFHPESPNCPWHYHGAFYWIRQDLLPRMREVRQKWFGVESWPGEMVNDPLDAGTLFGTFSLERLNMYCRSWADEQMVAGNKWITRQRQYFLGSKSSASSLPA